MQSSCEPASGDAATADTAETLALEKQRKRREREPIYYCKLICKHPVKLFLLTLAGHISMVVISVVLLVSGFDLLPVDFEGLPLEIRDKPWLPRHWAWDTKDEFDNYYDRTPSGSYRSEAYKRANVFLYYDTKNKNIFTKEHLEEIKYIEERVTSIPEYTEYCLWNYAISECSKPLSIVRYFDGTFAALNPVFNDTEFEHIGEVIYEASTNNHTKSAFQFFLGKSYNSTPTSAYSPITRSLIPIGYPLPDIDTEEDFEDALKDFVGDKLRPALESIATDTNGFEFIYRSHLLFIDIVFEQAMKDVLCAIGSMAFIFVFILIHTRSIWITWFAVFSIFTSFLCANLIYVIVFDFHYLGFFHILTIFIILGIGADDIFVFYDVWRNTSFEKYPSTAHRLSDAYRKSVFSMLFTSLTTALAFFANTISPLLATRSFGLFSGIVVLINYMSVIIYFPTVIVMYHMKFEKFAWPCFMICKDRWKCCSETNTNSENCEKYMHTSEYSDIHLNHLNPIYREYEATGDVGNEVRNDNRSSNRRTLTEVNVGKFGELKSIDHRILESDEPSKENKTSQPTCRHSEPHITNCDGKTNTGIHNGHKNNAFVLDSTESSGITFTDTKNSHERLQGRQVNRGTSKRGRKQSMASRFFSTHYLAIVTHSVVRWMILAVAGGVLAFFIVQVTKLEPDNEGLKVLKDSHVLMKAENHDLNSFMQSYEDIRLIIYIVWGMQQNDLSDCHFSTVKCKGKHVWDPDFNPSTPEAQLALRRFCDTMFNFSPATADEFRLKRNFLTGEYQINCFIKDLAEFLDEESAVTGANWSLPFDYNKAVSFMDARPQFYNSSEFNSSYKHFLEIPMSYWMSNRNTFKYNNAFYLYDDLLGEARGPFSTQLPGQAERYYGNNIRYLAIQVNTTIKYQTLGYSEGIPIMNRWEQFVNTELAKMPEGMRSGFQFTKLIWHWLVISETLAKNALLGVAIGVSVAFPILVLATGNIITGVIATFSMCCSTVCVLGVIPLGGWKLGVIASLNMCMVVGLTVDYVVHLAEAYSHSLHTDRQSRLRDMLAEIAVPVFFGACTSLGASLFMFIAQLSFFFQFGIFMFTTIGFSLYFSMTMFVTLMGMVGPQGDTGNVLAICRRVGNRCKQT